MTWGAGVSVDLGMCLWLGKTLIDDGKRGSGAIGAEKDQGRPGGVATAGVPAAKPRGGLWERADGRAADICSLAISDNIKGRVEKAVKLRFSRPGSWQGSGQEGRAW